jgi:hypothetical protein
MTQRNSRGTYLFVKCKAAKHRDGTKHLHSGVGLQRSVRSSFGVEAYRAEAD